MGKWIKYILLFIVVYSVINIVINLYDRQSWKDDQASIDKLIQYCAKETSDRFDEYNKDIETQTQDYIQKGTNFSNDDVPYTEYYKRCIADAIYNYTPEEFF